MIFFNNIKIKNFQSITNLEFAFNEGVHLVSGLNGSGKSSLFEAVLWCLYDRGRDKDVSHLGEGSCSVKLSLSKNGDNYCITRYCKHLEYKNRVFFEKNGNVVDTDVESQIAFLLGVSYEMFTFLYVVMQGIPLNFAIMTPTARKGVLEDLFNFTMWADLKKKFDNHCNEVSLKLNTILPSLNEAKSNKLILETKIHSLECDLSRLKNTENFNMDAVYAEIKTLKEEYDLITSELAGISIHEITDKEKEVSELIYKLTYELKNHINIINTGKCSQCGQSYPSKMVQESQEKIVYTKEKLAKLSNLKNSYNSDMNAFYKKNARLEQIHNNLYYLNKKISDQKIQVGTEISRVVEEISKNRGLLTGVFSKVVDLENVNKSVNDELTRAKSLSSLMLPSSNFRTSILVKYLDSINNYLNKICEELFIEPRMELSVSARNVGIDFSITRNGKRVKYSSFSAGERRMFDIILIHAFKRFILREIGTNINISVFDEVFDGLDECNVNVALSVLNQLHQNGFSVFVISHKENLKAKFDSVIDVIINRGISEVSLNGIVL